MQFLGQCQPFFPLFLGKNLPCDGSTPVAGMKTGVLTTERTHREELVVGFEPTT